MKETQTGEKYNKLNSKQRKVYLILFPKGDCLVVVSRITWMGLMNMVLQSFKRAFFQTKRRDATAPAAAVAKAKPQMNRRGSLAPDPSKRKLLRRLTTRAALKDIYSSRYCCCKKIVFVFVISIVKDSSTRRLTCQEDHLQ